MTVKLATGPVTWGVDFADTPDNPPWQQVIDDIVESGLPAMELGPVGYLPEDPEFVRSLLADRNLQSAGSFIFDDFHDPDARQRLTGIAERVSRLIAGSGGTLLSLIDKPDAVRVATAGRPSAAPRLDGDRWAAMLDQFNAIAAVAREHGVHPVVHPHVGGYVEFEDEIERLVAETDLDLCLDTGHLAYARMDPSRMIERYADRLGHVHFKDIRPDILARVDAEQLTFWEAIKEGIFCPIGDGLVDIAEVLAALDTIGYDGFATIEQDRVPGSGAPLDDVRKSVAVIENARAFSMIVDVPFPHRHELAEMPHWDAMRRRLCYVDINRGTINELDVATGDLHEIELTAPLGFVMPVAGSAVRLCGEGNDLIAIDGAGDELGRLPVEPGLDGNRMNEGKPDPEGRLWFGSMSKTREPEQSALYRFDTGGLSRIRTITTGNGTDWDVERGRMYHVDSPTQRIDVFDYDVATGEVENVRAWVTIDPDDGLPDGLTIDSEGCVWLALFQGGAIRRFDPDGAVMSDVAAPTPFVTCPVFGGDDLSTLFVTSSQHKIPPEERAGYPLAGAVFRIDTGVAGRPGNLVSPDVAVKVIG